MRWSGETVTVETHELKSIAVLPLCQDDQDPENAYFCNGMAEEMFAQLDKISGLKVKSRFVIESYIGKPMDLENMRRKAGLDFILTLSTFKSANDLRISVQLIDLLTGDQIWANTYDGDFTDKIFEFHSNTAKEIAAHLDVVITPEMEKELAKIPVENMKAYDEVIRGKYERQKWNYTGDLSYIKKANVFFENALKLVPDYVEALAGKCTVCIVSGKFDSAHYYADRIIELDRYSHSGYGHKAEIYYFSGLNDLAVEYYLKAIKLPPRNEEWIWWHAQLGLVYQEKIDFINSIKYLTKALELVDFKEVNWYQLLGWCYENLAEHDKAESCFRKIFGVDRENCLVIQSYVRNLLVQSRIEEALHFLDTICSVHECEERCLQSRFYAYMFGKRFSEAAESYDRFKRLNGIPNESDTVYLAYLYLNTGKPDSAEFILEAFRQGLEKQLVSNRTLRSYRKLLLAVVHGYMNNREEMIRYLNEAFDEGLKYLFIDRIRISPAYEILWSYPELGKMIDDQLEKRDSVRAEIAAMEDLEFRTLNTD